MHFALEAFLGSIGLVGSDHLDETKAARLLGVRILHDVALLDLSILAKQTSNLLLGEAGVDARHEQVGAWVAGARVLVVVLAMGTAVGGRATAVASIGRGAASSRVVQVAAGRAAPVAVVSTGLVVVATLLGLVLH
jgi:hypothetical protein